MRLNLRVLMLDEDLYDACKLFLSSLINTKRYNVNGKTQSGTYTNYVFSLCIASVNTNVNYQKAYTNNNM